MDDFSLSLSGGFPAQEVIVGGDYSLGGDLSPDISHFLGHEEIIFEDLEDSGLTSNSEDFSPPSLTSSSHHEDEIINIKEETSDEDSDTLSMSLNVDFDKLDRKKFNDKEFVLDRKKFLNKDFVFVTEDGKTAECFEEIVEATKPEVQSQYTKPKMSYAHLIAEALLTGSERMLTLNDIYIAINKQHPYYSLDAASGRNWQNAIRHNLTLNKAFIKVPRPATEGRGAYWKLEAGAEAQIFRRMARNYNRPKPVSFARQNIYYCDTTDINTVFITVPT